MEIRHETFIISDRDSSNWFRLSDLLDRLGWIHYPENVTGEEIDAGDDSENARIEGVDVPLNDVDLFNFLDACGVFDG